MNLLNLKPCFNFLLRPSICFYNFEALSYSHKCRRFKNLDGETKIYITIPQSYINQLKFSSLPSHTKEMPNSAIKKKSLKSPTIIVCRIFFFLGGGIKTLFLVIPHIHLLRTFQYFKRLDMIYCM